MGSGGIAGLGRIDGHGGEWFLTRGMLYGHEVEVRPDWYRDERKKARARQMNRKGAAEGGSAAAADEWVDGAADRKGLMMHMVVVRQIAEAFVQAGGCEESEGAGGEAGLGNMSSR